MNIQNRLQDIRPILKQYSLEPNFVEEFGNTKRVYTNNGVYALKKIPHNKGTGFIRHIQQLYQKGYNRIVPIFPTMDGRYAVLHQQELYYLMPWLSNEVKEDRKERNQQLFRELARMHTLSLKEIPVKKEEREEHYENTLLQWEKDTELIDGFVEVCEQKIYMSPFELLFCLYYNDVSQALRFSKRKLQEWFEKTKDNEKARVVTTHGKLSTEHFLFDDRGYGYFINFENSRQGSPIHDLLPYLSRTLNTFPKRNEDSIDWIYTYFRYLPFTDDEMLLFLSYFAHPGHILRVVENYHKTQKRKNERKFVVQLQRQYWLLKNTEYIVMRIDEIEAQKKQAQEQAKAAAQAQAQAQEGAQS